MSKTLSEDSEGKRASAADFGVRQLFRRPAPTAATTSGWGVPDLILSGGAATIASGSTGKPLPWADYSTPHTSTGPSAPFDISDANGLMFSLDITDTSDTGNDRYEVTTKREGWWASHMITHWDQVNTAGTAGHEIAGVRQRIFWTSNANIAFSPTEFISDSDWDIAGTYGSGTTLTIDTFGFGLDSYLSTILMPHYLPSNKTWQSSGRQHTGSSRGVSGTMWKFWWIATDDLSAWTFGNVFD